MNVSGDDYRNAAAALRMRAWSIAQTSRHAAHCAFPLDEGQPLAVEYITEAVRLARRVLALETAADSLDAQARVLDATYGDRLLRRALDALAAQEALLCDDDRETVSECDPTLGNEVRAYLESKEPRT